MKENAKIFIDGGGTSTKVYWKINDVIDFKIFAGLNIQNNEENALKTLSLIALFLKKFNVENIYIGMPGIERYSRKENILKIFKNNGQINIMTDIEVQELLFCKGKNYLMMCVGSGLIMIERTKTKKRILNGYGAIFQDHGSSFKFASKFIEQAILDSQNMIESKYVIYTKKFFNILEIEDVKLIYQDWNQIKPQLMKFTVFILLTHYNDLKKEADTILEVIFEEFSKYMNKVILDKSIKDVFIFGGMVKNAFYQGLFKKYFKDKGYNCFFN